MAFTKETARISGRKSKRGQGKVKTETKEIFTDILDANQGNIQEWLNETARESPSKALELLIKISAFVLPKPKAVDINLVQNKCSCEKLKELTDEELEEKLHQANRVLYSDDIYDPKTRKFKAN